MSHVLLIVILSAFSRNFCFMRGFTATVIRLWWYTCVCYRRTYCFYVEL